MAKEKLNVLGTNVRFERTSNGDYVCITDLTRDLEGKPTDYVRNWIRNASTIEFLGIWEKVNNPDFKMVEFHHFKTNLGRGDFLMSVKKWVDQTNAMGIISKAGRHGGTYAHSDIALQFAAWLKPEFYVYLIKEYQRLKRVEIKNWSVNKVIDNLNESINLLEEYHKPKKK